MVNGIVGEKDDDASGGRQTKRKATTIAEAAECLQSQVSHESIQFATPRSKSTSMKQAVRHSARKNKVELKP